MNRIQTIGGGSHAIDPELIGSLTAETDVERALYTADRGSPCAFFAPLHYEANYAYPLLVWLHGRKDDESQLKRIMPLVSTRNYVGVAVRGTMQIELAGGGRSYGWSQTAAHVARAEQRVFDAIELATGRYHVAPRRVFLAGFDAGGTMAFRLAMNHPERFAGVLSLAGEFPRSRMPLLRIGEARRMPVFLACGRASTSYSTDHVCTDLKLLYSAGMRVTLRQYPCSQQLSPWMLPDMDRWIMEQITAG